MPSALPELPSSRFALLIRPFGLTFRLSWLFVFLVVLTFQLLPSPGIAPSLFYARLAAKLLCFFLLGFLAPLSFWRFDSLTLGACLAIGGNCIAEVVQSLSQGHKSSWIEFAVKVMIIFAGFALGLNSRYERVIPMRQVPTQLDRQSK